jgi:hypothetical protein
MSGGQQAALGDLGWIVNRAMPTAGALVLLVLAARRERWSGGPLRADAMSGSP